MNKTVLHKYFEDFQLKKGIPNIKSGYTVTVSERITEGKKSRVQKFQGIVISNNHRGKIQHNILLRKKFEEFWIEKRFFLNSPLIEEIKVDSEAHARRSKLYYLRQYKGFTEKLKRLKK